MADEKLKLSDPAFRSADVPRTDDEFAGLSTGGPIVDTGVSHAHSEDVVLAGEDSSSSTASSDEPKSAKVLIASMGDASDDELETLADDDRKTVAEAAKAEQDKRASANDG